MKREREYHKVQMLTTVAMPTPNISASLSHTAYINNVSLVRLLAEGTAWQDKTRNILTLMQKIMVLQIFKSKLKSIVIIQRMLSALYIL